jgi:hypothetical protein
VITVNTKQLANQCSKIDRLLYDVLGYGNAGDNRDLVDAQIALSVFNLVFYEVCWIAQHADICIIVRGDVARAADDHNTMWDFA